MILFVNMKKIFSRFVSFFLLALCAASILSGCAVSKLKDIEVTSCSLESYSLRGFKGVEAVVCVGIDNPSIQFKITDLEGVIKYNGENLAKYTADSLQVEGKCSKVYDISCSAALADGVGLVRLMSIAQNRTLEGFTTDVQARLSLTNGKGKMLKFKNIDLAKLVE